MGGGHTEEQIPDIGDIIVFIEPDGWVFENSEFNIMVNLSAKQQIEGITMTVGVYGKEVVSVGGKKYKSLFYSKEIISKRIAPSPMGNSCQYAFVYPFTFSGKLPSTFHYESESLKCCVQYKAVARLLYNNTKKISSSSQVSYCSYDNFSVCPNHISRKGARDYLKLEVRLNKEIYSVDEKVEAVYTLNLLKPGLPLDLLEASIKCTLVQVTSISSSYISRRTLTNELVSFCCYASERTVLQARDSIQIPIEFDLEAIRLAHFLECITRSGHIENRYELHFQLFFTEDPTISENLVLPLFITPKSAT